MELKPENRQAEFGRANRKTSKKLFLVAVAMFGFGYALVPLYNVLCDITGLNGKTQTGELKEALAMKVDESRWITVEFLSQTSSELPWEFRPEQVEMKLHPGQVVTANYVARNVSSKSITGRAVPSVAPNKAAKYFVKVECFCFSEQKLAAGEAKEMPVRFYVDPKVSREVERITLSYTFYNLDALSGEKSNSQAALHTGKSGS